MPMRLSVQEAEGRAMVVKWGPAPSAGRLRAEGERLRRASHPGVVELVRSGPAGEGWELCTVHAGRPLEALGPLTASEAAGLVAGLASTVADLHDLGVVHGRIDASHVLVGQHGRAVLCGLGDGSRGCRPADDVAALGALLVELIGTDAEGEPIPERRWGRRRPWAGWDRRGLLLLADQASAEPATRSPSARRLAAAVAAAVPASASERKVAARPEAKRLGSSGTPSAPSAGVDPMASLRASALVGPGERSARRPALAAALAGVALVAVGVDRLRAPSADDAAARPHADLPAPAPEQVGSPLLGGEVTVAGVRYRLGRPGDEVLLGDWDCDGIATPALLRPGTGEVFVFPRWIEHGEERVVAVRTVPDAAQLVSGDDGRCPTLEVRTHDGSRVPVTDPPT